MRGNSFVSPVSVKRNLRVFGPPIGESRQLGYCLERSNMQEHNPHSLAYVLGNAATLLQNFGQASSLKSRGIPQAISTFIPYTVLPVPHKLMQLLGESEYLQCIVV